MKNHKLENRKIYIDFLKIIAVYMVLFNHTGTDGFVLFTIARTSKNTYLKGKDIRKICNF